MNKPTTTQKSRFLTREFIQFSFATALEATYVEIVMMLS